MTFDEVMMTRRSCRSFNGKAVNKETVLNCIAAAQMAPSWKNSQTARYYAIFDSELLARVRAEALPPGNAHACAGAGCLLVCTFVADRSGFTREGLAEDAEGNMWGAYDTGLAHQNLLLQAHAAGMASLVMGLRDAERLRALLVIPATEIILPVIALGYSDKTAKAPVRKVIDDIVNCY